MTLLSNMAKQTSLQVTSFSEQMVSTNLPYDICFAWKLSRRAARWEREAEEDSLFTNNEPQIA